MRSDILAAGGWPSTREVVVDRLNGATLVPFFVLTICVFYDTALQELIKNEKSILSLAGLIGTIFVIAEIAKTFPPAPAAVTLPAGATPTPPAGATPGAPMPQNPPQI